MLTIVQQRIIATLAKYGPMNLKTLMFRAKLGYDAKWQLKRLEEMGLLKVSWELGRSGSGSYVITLTSTGQTIGEYLVEIQSILSSMQAKQYNKKRQILAQ